MTRLIEQELVVSPQVRNVRADYRKYKVDIDAWEPRPMPAGWRPPAPVRRPAPVPRPWLRTAS